MAPSTRTQNAIVAGLTALAVGASAYAVWSVGRPHPALEGPAMARGAVQPADADAVTATGTDEEAGTASSAATAEPQESPSPPPSQESEPSVKAWVDAWSDDEADLLVIGDGFSNLPTQWVQLWARGLSDERAVRIHHWGEAADVGFNEPIVLSESGGDPLTVWSASRAGSRIEAAAQRYDRFVSASAEPDAVLITLGLSSANEDVTAGLDALVDQIDKTVPVLISVGPEGLYAEGVGDALLAWAQEHNDRVSVVDLRISAPGNPTAEQWARAFEQALDQS